MSHSPFAVQSPPRPNARETFPAADPSLVGAASRRRGGPLVLSDQLIAKTSPRPRANGEAAMSTTGHFLCRQRYLSRPAPSSCLRSCWRCVPQDPRPSSGGKPSSMSANRVRSRWPSTRSAARLVCSGRPAWPVALGFGPRDRIEVVDADQAITACMNGRGARSIQYILAEIGLDHVGILLGQDASRLARHDPDWVPMNCGSCGLFHAARWATTMACTTRPISAVFAALGSEGHHERGRVALPPRRMYEGRLNKEARRGELFHPPIGYVREPGSGLTFDPDEQA